MEKVKERKRKDRKRERKIKEIKFFSKYRMTGCYVDYVYFNYINSFSISEFPGEKGNEERGKSFPRRGKCVM